MTAPVFKIEARPGGRYRVMRDGQRASQEFSSRLLAERRMDMLEAAARPRRKRSCICCRKMIESEGPHHRMCVDCRRTASDDGMIDVTLDFGGRVR